jgi:glycosyltransferase involved in cell wall biosynthesis
MKLAVFSPMPPICSEISEYIENLLPHIVNYLDVDIFINDDEPSTIQKTCYNIFSHRDFESRHIKNSYQMILYHMADDRAHHYMYPYLLHYPGITVLHDYSFHEFFSKLETTPGYKNKYLEELIYNFGPRAGQLAYRYTHNLWTEVDDAIYPLNKRIIDNSLGIIVYSRASEREIEKKSPGTDIKRIMKAVPVKKTFFSRKSDAKEKVGIPYDKFVFGILEYRDISEKTAIVIRGFEKLIKTFDKSILLLIGYRNDKKIYRLVTELNIEESVLFIGDVSKEDLFNYACATDIVFSLHLPPIDASLPVVLKLMGMGLPVVIPNYSVFREIPDNCCIKTDTSVRDKTIKNLLQAVYPLITDNKLRKSVGENAKKIIHENHNFENNAKSYHEFISKIYRKTLMSNNNILNRIKEELEGFGINEQFLYDLSYFDILKKELEFE